MSKIKKTILPNASEVQWRLCIPISGKCKLNYSKMSPHTCYEVYYQRDKQQEMLLRMWRKWCYICWIKGCHMLLVGMEMAVATIENSMEILQKVKREAPYDTAIQLLSIYLKKMKTNQKRYYAPLCTLYHFYNTQYMEATQVPINR